MPRNCTIRRVMTLLTTNFGEIGPARAFQMYPITTDRRLRFLPLLCFFRLEFECVGGVLYQPSKLGGRGASPPERDNGRGCERTASIPRGPPGGIACSDATPAIPPGRPRRLAATRPRFHLPSSTSLSQDKEGGFFRAGRRTARRTATLSRVGQSSILFRARTMVLSRAYASFTEPERPQGTPPWFPRCVL